MPGRRSLGANPEDAKDLLRQAAERCVERYGIRKTTMDDIAKEAGVSRPSLYRYYNDRDELFLSVVAQRSRALIERARQFIARQGSFEDSLVAGLLYIAEHGRRDPFLRHLAASDDSVYSQRLLADHNAAGEFAKEFWDPLFRDAESTGELSPDFDRAEGYVWLAQLGLLLMSLGETYSRAELGLMLRNFVVPAFAAGSPASGLAMSGVTFDSTDREQSSGPASDPAGQEEFGTTNSWM